MSEITLKELKKALQEAINNLEEKEKAISVGSLEKKKILVTRIDALRGVLRFINGDPEALS